MKKILEEINPITNVEIFKRKLWMEEYAYRMKKWMKGERMPPIRIDAEPHRKCNLNCIFCARRSPPDLGERSNKNKLPEKRWIEIAKESGEMGVKSWNISGLCEPMCEPKLVLSLMETIKAYDMFGELTTNGTLWKEKYIKKTIEIGWDSICISIDSPSPKIHNYLRGGVKGTFEKATKTLKMFKKWRSELRSETPLLTINMVLNKLNFDKIPEMVDLTYKLGGDALFVEPMLVYTEESSKLKLNKDQIKQIPNFIERANELAKEYGIFTTITCITPEREFQGSLIGKTGNIKEILIKDTEKYSDKLLSTPCYYPWFYLMIRGDGSVVHCGEWNSSLGNIKNKNLREIWFGKKIEKIRERFMLKDLPESCNRCRPNVIEDMREIRKRMIKYSDVSNLQKELIQTLIENRELKKWIYKLKKELNLSLSDISHRRTGLCEHEKELIKIKRSLSYRFGKKIEKTPIGKVIKKIFGVHV